ncbi:MAG: hypothetical protein RIC95_14960 [Vicingaceae bacterium]
MASANVTVNDVPDEVMQEYKDSFIYDEDGVLVGAFIESLEDYLSSNEINDLFTSDVISTIADGSTDINVFQGYKPKPRGCKSNSRWICQVRGELQN